MKNTPKEIYTAIEMAKAFKVSSKAIYNFKDEGMPTVTTKPVRFDYDDCLEWLKKRSK